MDAVVSDAGNVDLRSLPPSGWDFSCDFEVDYGSTKHATIVYAALAVDKELQPDKVKRKVSVSDGKLQVHFEAVEARFLRASFSAFVDLMILASKIIEEFGLFLPAVVRPILDSFEKAKQVQQPAPSDVVAGMTGKEPE